MRNSDIDTPSQAWVPLKWDSLPKGVPERMHPDTIFRLGSDFEFLCVCIQCIINYKMTRCLHQDNPDTIQMTLRFVQESFQCHKLQPTLVVVHWTMSRHLLETDIRSTTLKYSSIYLWILDI